jgi:hypothetical protein
LDAIEVLDLLATRWSLVRRKWNDVDFSDAIEMVAVKSKVAKVGSETSRGTGVDRGLSCWGVTEATAKYTK